MVAILFSIAHVRWVHTGDDTLGKWWRFTIFRRQVAFALVSPYLAYWRRSLFAMASVFDVVVVVMLVCVILVFLLMLRAWGAVRHFVVEFS